jgi:hypothetical protein
VALQLQDFFVVVEITANTSANNPISVDVLVEGYELRRIAYLIPQGWRALAGFAVYYGIEHHRCSAYKFSGGSA